MSAFTQPVFNLGELDDVNPVLTDGGYLQWDEFTGQFRTVPVDLSAYAPLVHPHFTGPVGINTDSPHGAYGLDIVGSARVDGDWAVVNRGHGLLMNGGSVVTDASANVDISAAFGSPMIHVTGSGVGIGATTTPSVKLDVKGVYSSANSNDVMTSVAANGIAIQADVVPGGFNCAMPGLIWYSQDNDPTVPKAAIWSRVTGGGSYLHLGTSNNYAAGLTNQGIVVDYQGRVGVGGAVLNPSTALEVGGTITSQSTTDVLRAPWFAGEYPIVHAPFGSGSNYDLGLAVDGGVRSVTMYSKAADESGFLAFQTGSSRTERMRISNTGVNVGVNLTVSGPGIALTGTPSSGLGVPGSTFVGGIQWYDDGTLRNSIINQSGVGRLAFQSTGMSTAGFGFFTGGAGSAGTEKMTIDNSGKVGIGVPNPDAQLHIGSATGTNVKLLQIGEPQFSDTYGLILRSLAGDGTYRMHGFTAGVESTNPIITFDRPHERVGIGTSAPAFKFDVNGDANFSTSANNGILYLGGLRAMEMWGGAFLYVGNADNVVYMQGQLTVQGSNTAGSFQSTTWGPYTGLYLNNWNLYRAYGESGDVVTAHKFDTYTPLVRTGSNIASFSNGGASVLTLDKNGCFNFPDPASGSYRPAINFRHTDSLLTGLQGNESTVNLHGTNGLLVDTYNGPLDIVAGNGSALTLKTGSVGVETDRLIVMGTGQIGIGVTPNPSGATSGQLALVANPFTIYGVFDAPSAGYAYHMYKAQGDIIGYIGQGTMMSGPAATDFGMRAENNLVFAIGPFEKMRINSLGYIGIGTNNPGSELDLVGNMSVTGTLIVKNVITESTVLAYSATPVIDFSGGQSKTITLAGDATFSTSNKTAGKSVKLRIIGQAAAISALTWPGWTWVGPNGALASVPANKTAIVATESFGATDADVVASYALQA